MNIGKRIRELRGTRGVQECATAVGVTRSAWYQWEEKEDQQSLKHENLVALARFFQLSVEEFLQEDLPNILREPGTKYVMDDSRYYNVRHYDARMSAGPGNGNGSNPDWRVVPVPRWMIPDDIDPSMVVIVGIEGDSMYPLLNDGDFALVNRAQNRLKEGKIFAFNDGDHQRVKKFVKRIGGGWLMKSENPDYAREDQTIAPHEFDKFSIIGRVFKSIGNL